jgi:hypothetical protein
MGGDMSNSISSDVVRALRTHIWSVQRLIDNGASFDKDSPAPDELDQEITQLLNIKNNWKIEVTQCKNTSKE